VAYVWDARGSKIPRTRNVAQGMKEDGIYDIEQLVYNVLEIVSPVDCQETR
jgi:hypothetical protein